MGTHIRTGHGRKRGLERGAGATAVAYGGTRATSAYDRTEEPPSEAAESARSEEGVAREGEGEGDAMTETGGPKLGGVDAAAGVAGGEGRRRGALSRLSRRYHRVQGHRRAVLLRSGEWTPGAQERPQGPLHQHRHLDGRVREREGRGDPRALPPAQGLQEDPLQGH